MLDNNKWLNAFLLLTLLNSSTFASEYDTDDRLNNLVDKFLTNLLDKDEKSIIENFLDSPEYYAKGKKLNEDIYSFLYSMDINKSKKNHYRYNIKRGHFKKNNMAER